MACPSCSVELHSTCSDLVEGKCCCERAEVRGQDRDSSTSNGTDVLEEDDSSSRSRRSKSNRRRRNRNLRDQQSTGRKRAAVAYPLNRVSPCEWQGLKFAGGSRFPIIGCFEGLQQARHHGPDKNTLNNDEGNVHRICHACHNRWHTLNDIGYEWDGTHQPHDPETKATVQEVLENELKWAGKQTVKARD